MRATDALCLVRSAGSTACSLQSILVWARFKLLSSSHVGGLLTVRLCLWMGCLCSYMRFMVAIRLFRSV
jgi:hypothetical protein